MASLKKAVATIHQDREWWRKILLGGALWLTVVGYPVVEGYQIESIDNTKNGYPTPLPRWSDLGTKMVQGIFGLLIDFFYFIFPLLASGMVLLCSALALSLTGETGDLLRLVGQAIGLIVLLWLLLVWMLGVSPIGKRLFVGEGQPNQALSSKVIRGALSQEARGVYLRARLQSLPLYLMPLTLLTAAWLSADRGWWLALLLLWLGLSALLYARLATVQLYDLAAREIERRRFEAFRARSRAS